MTKTSVKTVSAMLLPAVATMLFVQACGGGGAALAQQTPDPLEGVWEGPVTLRDCASGNAVATFRGSQAFHHGGTMSDTNSNPTVTRGPGSGTWVRNGATYTIKFRFFTYDNTGAPTGTARVTRTVTLSADGKTATSTNSSVLEDTNGATLRSTCGTDVGTKVL